MWKLILISALASLSVLLACQKLTPPATPPAKTIAENEEEFQSELDSDSEMRAEVRQAVYEFAKNKLPAWKLKGLAIEPYQYNVFWAAADIEKDGRELVVDLAVRKFFPESGSAYWKVVSLHKTLQEQMHDINDADVWKKLNEATSDSESNEGRPDPRR